MIVEQGIPSMPNDGDRVKAKSFLFGEEILELYVESQLDVRFWRFLFKEAGFDKLEIKPARAARGSNGKSEIQKCISDNIIKPCDNILVAIDSDYDFLKDEKAQFYLNEFVFQTYVYSIESFYFFPEGLYEICLDCTNTCNNDKNNLDIDSLFLRWSQAYYSVFIKYIKENCKESKELLYNSLKNLDVYDLKGFEEVEQQPLYEELDDKGLNIKNLCLFVNGHLLEEVVLRETKKVTYKLLEREKNNILAKTDQSAKDINAQIYKSTSDILATFRARNLEQHPFIERIKQDLLDFRQKYYT